MTAGFWGARASSPSAVLGGGGAAAAAAAAAAPVAAARAAGAAAAAAAPRRLVRDARRAPRGDRRERARQQRQPRPRHDYAGGELRRRVHRREQQNLDSHERRLVLALQRLELDDGVVRRGGVGGGRGGRGGERLAAAAELGGARGPPLVRGGDDVLLFARACL